MLPQKRSPEAFLSYWFSGIKWLLKNDPLFERFFLQPLIPAFRI